MQINSHISVKAFPTAFRMGLLTLVLTCLGLGSGSVKANHFWGTSLRYECLGNNIYRVHWTGIRDCLGSAIIPNGTQIEALQPNCTLPIAVGGWSNTQVSDITPICPTLLSRCHSGGQFFGIEEHHQSRDYDFSAVNCSTYRWSLQTLRTSYIDTGPASSTLYMQTSALDLGLTACNSNPVFNYPQKMIITVGQPALYSQSATDPDGDSLVYSLASCIQSSSTMVPYTAPNNANNPLGTDYSMTIDPMNGDVEILPTPGNSAFNALVCIKVEEYRNGVKIGEIIRDHILIILPTTMPNNYPILHPFINLQGVNQVQNDTLFVPNGFPFCFDLPVMDLDSLDQSFLTWDQGIQGMALLDPTTGLPRDTVQGNVARFCWTPAQNGTFTFLFSARDGACPVEGFAQNTITVIVGNSLPPVTGAGSITSSQCQTFLFTALPQFGIAPYTYEWTGNGGLSGSPARFDSTFSFAYSSAGTYSVSLTVTDSIGDSYVWTDTVTAETLLEGTVLTSSGAPFSNRWVYLMSINNVDSTSLVLDSTSTNLAGEYSFCLTDSNVVLSAWPDAASFPTQLPTYADSALVYQDGHLHSPGAGIQQDIILQEKMTSMGSASLGGTAYKSSVMGNAVDHLRIVLLNGNQEPVGWTRTDANGQFQFSGLAADSFFIWVDKPYIDNQLGPMVRLNAGMANQDSMTFVLHPTWLERILPATGLPSFIANTPDFEIGPNPFTHRFRIRGILPYVGPVRVHLIDLEGRVLLDLHWKDLPQGQVDLDVDPGVLPSGVYLLRIETDEGMVTRRVLRSTPGWER